MRLKIYAGEGGDFLSAISCVINCHHHLHGCCHQETPKFGGEESQADVQDKLQHMRSMMTYLEASRWMLSIMVMVVMLRRVMRVSY